MKEWAPAREQKGTVTKITSPAFFHVLTVELPPDIRVVKLLKSDTGKEFPGSTSFMQHPAKDHSL
jgi:hypothetical protein